MNRLLLRLDWLVFVFLIKIFFTWFFLRVQRQFCNFTSRPLSHKRIPAGLEWDEIRRLFLIRDSFLYFELILTYFFYDILAVLSLLNIPLKMFLIHAFKTWLTLVKLAKICVLTLILSICLFIFLRSIRIGVRSWWRWAIHFVNIVNFLS